MVLLPTSRGEAERLVAQFLRTLGSGGNFLSGGKLGTRLQALDSRREQKHSGRTLICVNDRGAERKPFCYSLNLLLPPNSFRDTRGASPALVAVHALNLP